MLKKIKKFKIHIRPSYVLRNLKRSSNLNFNGDELEKKIQQEIEKVQHLFSPSAIYETCSKMQCPAPLSPLWNQAPNDAISISLIAASIGSQIEKEMEKSSNGTENIRTQILDAISKESLEQCIHFVLKLIAEEAQDENCEMSVPIPMEASYLEPALSFLEASKADIHSGADGNLRPIYSTVSYCFWQPVAKSKSAKTR